MGALNEAFGFLNSHPKLVLGAAAAAGIYSSHPVRAFAQGASNVMFDDPEAIHHAFRGAMTGVNQSMLGSIGVQSQWTGLQPGMSALSHQDTANYYRGPNPNPDGSIVFGLYNSRLR